MIQIPLKFLPDTMTVRELDTSTDYEGTYQAPYTIEHVRFEPVEAINQNAYKIADGARGRIFIDAVNSTPAKAPMLGSKVSINDALNMRVLTCTPYQGIDAIHHWEVDVG